MGKTLWTVAFAVTFLVFQAEAAWGWIYRVHDATELQEALTEAASNGWDDTIRVAQGTYHGNFVYDSSEGRRISVRGGYTGAFLNDRELDPSNTILDADGSGQVLYIRDEAGGEIEVEGFTIRNGAGESGGGGGLFASSYSASGATGKVTINQNAITDNDAYWQGAGIFTNSYSESGQSGNVVISNNTVTGNESGGGGGPFSHGAGVYASSYSGSGLSGDVILSDNEFADNIGLKFGGGAFAYSWGAGEVVLTGNAFSNNSAQVAGGVYAYSNGGPVTMTDNTFSGNTADDHSGGGAYAGSDFGSVTLTGNTFTDNSAAAGGGAFAYSETETITATGNTFTGNSVFRSSGPTSDGGGLYADQHHDGTVIITRNVFDGNSATRSGGGVYARSMGTTGTVILTHNTMTGNMGGSWGSSLGGGAEVYANGLATVENNLFAGNYAFDGGAAYVRGGNPGANVVNNTIIGSSTDSTSSYKSALHLFLPSDTLSRVYNNIIWDTSTESGPGTDLYIYETELAGLDSLGSAEIHHNILHSLGFRWGDNVIAGDNIDLDPLLVDTGDPDPANWDLHLSAASPAIDAGTDVGAPATDFEGDVRPQRYGYDIGADEAIGDSDGDGISDEIDTSPGSFSNAFEDGTGTFGVITDRGDQELAITDALDPEGVRITANALGGTSPARVRFCGGSYTAVLSAGEYLVRGCSFEIDVISGQADLTLLASSGRPATASLLTGNGLMFDPHLFSITTRPTNTEPVVVVVGGDEVTVAPGESALLSGACDVDADGDVDLHDTQAIFDARGTPASGPDDPMDADGDGNITVNDGRICVLECDLENCEEPPPTGGSEAAPASCGLLGVEPFLLLGLPLWARRRRGRCR